MSTIRSILPSAIGISAIDVVLLLGHGYLAQLFPILVKTSDETVQVGSKVEVQFQLTPRDNPTTTYINTEQFTQGQHIIPPGIEQRLIGMHPGEIKPFPLSAEEGVGPYDETKIQIIPTADLPLETREGDTVNDDAGRTARVVAILPEQTVLDLNHPLAGTPLIVTLQIITIEKPAGLRRPPAEPNAPSRFSSAVTPPQSPCVAGHVHFQTRGLPSFGNYAGGV